MGVTMVEIVCPQCGNAREKYIGHLNRANKIGAPVYCSKACSGIARRDNKTIEQKKAEKSEYDKAYREKNLEIKKVKAKEYFKRTYDPAKAAIERKKTMPRHVEYCRQPEYRKYKQQYDKKYRAKKDYGEFYEAAIVLTEIEKIVDSREAFKVNKLYRKSTTVKKRKNGTKRA